jgi:hypothetical protein
MRKLCSRTHAYAGRSSSRRLPPGVKSANRVEQAAVPGMRSATEPGEDHITRRLPVESVGSSGKTGPARGSTQNGGVALPDFALGFCGLLRQQSYEERMRL